MKTEFFPDLAGRHLLDCHLSEPILSKQQTRLHLGKVTKWEKLSIIFQLDSDAGVPAWSPAVQLQEQVGEGEVDLEVETCLSLLSNHPGMLQGRLINSPLCFGFSSGYPVATSESSNGWDEHQGDGL